MGGGDQDNQLSWTKSHDWQAMARTHALEHVALAADVLSEEEADVARLSMDVARDVDERLRRNGDELVEEALVAALARRLSEHRNEGGAERQRLAGGGKDRRKEDARQ